MIAPIREAEPGSENRPRTPREVRRLVASMFLNEEDKAHRPAPAIPRWKAWLLVAWATTVTVVYLAAMLNLI